VKWNHVRVKRGVLHIRLPTSDISDLRLSLLEIKSTLLIPYNGIGLCTNSGNWWYAYVKNGTVLSFLVDKALISKECPENVLEEMTAQINFAYKYSAVWYTQMLEYFWDFTNKNEKVNVGEVSAVAWDLAMESGIPPKEKWDG